VVNLNVDDLTTLVKNQIAQFAKLTKVDVAFLVSELSKKEDIPRYNAFLLLQANPHISPHTYSQRDRLEQKLSSGNSCQHNLGLMLIVENIRQDKQGKFNYVLSKYLRCCTNEKFITARQAIQGLSSILEATNKHNEKIS
jgi:hypothetical protein